MKSGDELVPKSAGDEGRVGDAAAVVEDSGVGGFETTGTFS